MVVVTGPGRAVRPPVLHSSHPPAAWSGTSWPRGVTHAAKARREGNTFFPAHYKARNFFAADGVKREFRVFAGNQT